MGTLRTQVKLPKQISLANWEVTEDGVDINGTYNYISFPSPITSFPLEGTESGVTYNLYASENGSEYSLIYSGGTPIVEGYKHSSLESYMFYDGSQWALWFDGTYQWVNPNGTQNILPFNNWQIYFAQGGAGDIQVTDGSTAKNILFLVKKTNTGSGGVSTSILTAGSIYNFSTNSASNGRNFNTIATNENYFDFLLTEMGYVPSVFKAFVTSQSGIVIDFTKHAIVTQARTSSPITNINFLNMGNRSMRVTLGNTTAGLPANYFRIHIIDRRGWDNINLTNNSQSTILEDYNFNLNLGGSILHYWELDESSGNRVDLVNGNDLFEANDPIPNTIGRINYAADFDAVDNSRFLYNDTVSSDNTFSISSWVKLNAYNAIQEQDLWGVNSDPATVASLFVSLSNQFEFYNTPGNVTLTTSIIPDLETWYHTVLVVNRNQMYLYINGNLAGTQYIVGVTTFNNAFVGFYLSNDYYDGVPNYQINGAIDEVGIWNRMLNESEIKALYNFGNGLPVENFYT
jgi:hypothetical protein